MNLHYPLSHLSVVSCVVVLSLRCTMSIQLAKIHYPLAVLYSLYEWRNKFIQHQNTDQKIYTHQIIPTSTIMVFSTNWLFQLISLFLCNNVPTCGCLCHSADGWRFFAKWFQLSSDENQLKVTTNAFAISICWTEQTILRENHDCPDTSQSHIRQ